MYGWVNWLDNECMTSCECRVTFITWRSVPLFLCFHPHPNMLKLPSYMTNIGGPNFPIQQKKSGLDLTNITHCQMDSFSTDSDLFFHFNSDSHVCDITASRDTAPKRKHPFLCSLYYASLAK